MTKFTGTAELLALCRDSKIPAIITSAGITNVISKVLEAHGVESDHDEHFHIDANHMEFHTDGKSKG
jgi:2-hydroxy-3-keto-5-methylthiopentenyl-1-phosphate phosphatase